MKPIKIICIAILFFLIRNDVFAQVTRPYQNGSVWSITFVKIKAGMEVPYLTHVAISWKGLRELEKKEGIILSYKVLQTESHETSDWNLILMIEYKNLAALEASEAKSESIEQKFIGNDEKIIQGYKDRLEIREITGNRTAREIILNQKSEESIIERIKII